MRPWIKTFLPESRYERWTLIGLGTLFAGLIVFLLVANNPWDASMAGRLAEGKHLRTRDFAVMGLWWAALGNLIFTALFLLTARLWLPLLASTQAPQGAGGGWAVGAHRPGLWWMAVAGAVVLCAVLCWPRMTQSLWGDEEYSLRHFVLGYYKQLSDGELQFRPRSLAESLWRYNPNNHFLFTLASRASLGLWSWFSTGSGLPFSEVAFRLPAFLAGMLCLPAMALLLARLGFPRAGLFAAYLLALHPWFLKYAGEARGYSTMLLFSILAIYCLLEALQRGTLRWWMGFAAGNFCMLYAYPGAVYLVFTQGIVALVAVLRERGQLVRLVFSGGLSFMFFVQLVAPAIPQMVLWLQRERAHGIQGPAWVLDFWGYLTTGMAWKTWDATNPLAHSVRDLPDGLYGFVLVVLPLVALAGLIRLIASGRIHAHLALAWIAAPILAYVQAQLSGTVLYLWYLIYALPAFVIFLAVGLSWPRKKAVSMACFLIFAGLYFLATDSRRQTLRNHAVEPQRDSVALTRPNFNPHSEENQHILTATVTFGTKFYDPRQIQIKSREHLESLMEKSDRNSWPLFINFGCEGFSRSAQPEVMDLIENSGRFELVQRLFGADGAQNTRAVYRYKPGFIRASPNYGDGH